MTHNQEDQHPALKNLIYIAIPDEFKKNVGDFPLDPDIMLPVETQGPADQWNLQDLTWEQIISAMLKILAYAPEHEDAEYYRTFVQAAKPDIVNELTETAVLKARNHDFEIAEEIFRALTGLLPGDQKMVLNLALLYEQRARAYESLEKEELQNHYENLAVEAYRELFSLDEVLPEVHLNAAYFFLRLRNYDRAREQFQAYLENDTTGEEKRSEAQRIISEIDSQNLMDQLFKEAYDFIRMGKEQEGIEKISKFLSSHPNVWNAWFLLGWGHRRLGQYEQGRDAFQKSLELGKAAEQVDTLNELAICEMELGDLESSQKHLTAALSTEPENTKIISNLGILALRRGNREQAGGYFQTVLEIAPDDPIARRYIETLDE